MYASKTTKISCSENDCKAFFSTERSLSNHIRTKHVALTEQSCVIDDPSVRLAWIIIKNIKKKCKTCAKQVFDLADHSKRCTGRESKIFYCKVKNCGESFFKQCTLNSHVYSLHKPRKQCPYKDCGASLKPSYFTSHIKNIHKKLRKPCDNCGKQITILGLRLHIVRCTSKKVKKFHCSEKNCDSSFSSLASLNAHLKKNREVPVKCTIKNCQVFVRPSYLEFHIKSIHEKAQQLCKNCNKEVPIHMFKRHYQICINNGERAFACKEKDCKSAFTNAGSLSAHMWDVHKPLIKCPHKDCSSYIKRRSLNTHIRDVHDKIKQTCPNCGKLVRYSALKRHLNSCANIGRREFPCPEDSCEALYKTKPGLQRHIKRDHYN